MEIIKQRIRALRESVGLSQNKLGKLVGLPQSSINRYEQGQSTPSAKTLRWYADYFDVSVDYLLGREPSDETQEMLEYLHKNPEMRVLLSSSAKLEKEDLEAVVAIVRRMNKEHDLE